MTVQLGKLIEEETNRDAVHIAIIPMTSDEKLYPGQHVGIVDKKASSKAKKKIGIVDPFLLESAIYPGQIFYLCLYPNTITTIRHDWEHPSIKFHDGVYQQEETPKNKIVEDMEAKAIKRIHDIADLAGLEYEEIMQGAKDFLDYGDYLCDGGRWEGFYIPEDFWDCYMLVTGITVPEHKRVNFFTCAC